MHGPFGAAHRSDAFSGPPHGSQRVHTPAPLRALLHCAGSKVTVTYTARVLPDGPVFDQKTAEEPLTFTTDEGGCWAVPPLQA